MAIRFGTSGSTRFVLKVGRIDPNDSLPLTTAKEQIFLLGVCAENRLGMRLSCQKSEVLESQYLSQFQKTGAKRGQGS